MADDSGPDSIRRTVRTSLAICESRAVGDRHGYSQVCPPGFVRADSMEPLYSRYAYERWDIAESARYASQGNPDHFDRMPALEEPEVSVALRERIRFTRADWSCLPVENWGVDALFARNALPRKSALDQAHVLSEWARVVRPGGVAFVVQHNFSGADIESVLRKAGWMEARILQRERPAGSGLIGFQVLYSSG